MAQVLAILIDNAFSYTPKGGSVTLLLTLSSSLSAGKNICQEKFPVPTGYVSFSVADTGPGVPPKEREKIFQRFYRAEASRSDRSHFGLGLSIAQEIVALHKGTISVTDAAGCGAVFTVALPVCGSPD